MRARTHSHAHACAHTHATHTHARTHACTDTCTHTFPTFALCLQLDFALDNSGLEREVALESLRQSGSGYGISEAPAAIQCVNCDIESSGAMQVWRAMPFALAAGLSLLIS